MTEAFIEINPAASGLDFDRATCESKSLSVISFHVQPAPLIKIDPNEQTNTIHRTSDEKNESLECKIAPNKPQKQGSNNNHVPIGLSILDNLKNDLDHSGQ